ncbi:Zinc-finger protein [Beijerinckiaceae bacterium RH AL1]|nr:DUF983 domain-containing protein [Beijerinckiaceae bacterium]VVB46099.1 Zinc-finger protein [Beijerinckiaceae bacterium RH CH11]VVB46181.1 Zinc-finger protein [Beijerinckiaceae bacterium RH AL8]VVC55202.1 Zinc-finger protein [Beijerinckiaceae bacterium RH AL1]
MSAMTSVASAEVALGKRDLRQSVLRGLRETCPHCGKGRLFGRYLKVVPRCESCGEDLSHQRADDAPPYVTMMIVGHLLILGVALLEDTYAPPTWVHLAIWLPLTVALSLVLLPRVKGAIVGLQWANRMHGFDGA